MAGSTFPKGGVHPEEHKELTEHLAIEEMRLKVVAGDEKYEFRCADPAVVESLYSDRDKISGIKERLEGVKLEDLAITRIRKAISNLNADRVSLFVENKKLFA